MAQVQTNTIFIPESAPGVYDPASKQTSGSQFVQSFGSETHQSTMSSNLSSASYATLSQALHLDPFTSQSSYPVSHTGFEHSYGLHFVPSFVLGAFEFSNLAPPYATGNPHIWQGSPYSSQWTCYETVADSSSFNTYPFYPSMASHTVPTEMLQDNHVLGDQGYYGSSGGQM
ncbi:hypothetical protein F5880DRAFT_1617846 [Lentinula raphanica]|nr:hypothetical protein F5880DRAFT_1617846 [Lentinula raphanica]